MIHTPAPRSDYDVEPGDEFLRFDQIRSDHVGRVFEFRNPDGSGYRGRLIDATYHQLQGTVVVQFEGEQLGIFRNPDFDILLKHPGFELPGDVDTDGGTPDLLGAADYIRDAVDAAKERES